MNSFTEKNLRVTITLADDSSTVFNTSGDNTLILKDLRMTASIVQNARQATSMDLKIWGMLPKDMDALTVAFIDPDSLRNNLVVLEADSGNGFRQVFQGTILEAQPDFQSAPNVSFQILGMISYFQQVSITPPLSYSGAVSIDTIGEHLAGLLGLSYVSGGATAVLTDQYIPGSVFDQLRAACEAANADFYFIGDSLVITPVLQPLAVEPAVMLSPSSGLLGYPMYTRQGLMVQAIFDPAFACATPIEIQGSVVKGTNGRWYPMSMQHDLSSNYPGGPWATSLRCLKAPI